MESDQEANTAMKNLNNKEVEGRTMSVTVAREKQDKKSNNFGGGKRSW